MLAKAAFQWMSPSGKNARLSVLIFHRVSAKVDPLFRQEMHADRFNEVCSWLKSWFNVLPLDVAVTRLKDGTLPARAACITFDDGYADNHHVAMPILKQHGLTATFFIATGFLNGGRMWNDTIIESVRATRLPVLDTSSLVLGCYPLASDHDKRAAIDSLLKQIKYRPVGERIAITNQIAHLAQAELPDNLMMTSKEVVAMRHAGMQIGAHTVTHPILARLSNEQARSEILTSKEYLEQLLNERVGLFAYPNGKPVEDYSPQTVNIVRSLGFDAAVSTQWGISVSGDDMLQIRRFTPWDESRSRFAMRMLTNLRSS